MMESFEVDGIFYSKFLSSPHSACYDLIHHIRLDDSTDAILEKIGQSNSEQKKCFFLEAGPPHFYHRGSWVSDELNNFVKLCKKNNIYNADFYVPCFGPMFHDDFDILNDNYFKWNFIRFVVDIPYQSPAVSDIDPSDSRLFLEKIKYNFSHVNFTHRIHRQLFSKFLIAENMVTTNCVNINGHTPDSGRYRSKYRSKKTAGSLWKGTNDEWNLNERLLRLWRETDLIEHQNPDADPHHLINLEFIKKSGVHIVSETVFHYPYPFLTEKTMTALLSSRPFILIGASGSLRLLKEKGYKTFDDVFDESYDSITNPSDRMEAIFKIVKEIHNRSLDQIKQNVLQCRNKVLHNRNLMVRAIQSTHGKEGK